MTVEQIKQGYGKTLATQTELSILLKLLVKAIDYCSEASNQNKYLTTLAKLV